MQAMSDNKSITAQVAKILDKLPIQAQNLVLAYAHSLRLQYKAPSPDNPYPLRGTASFDLDPSEPAVEAEEWNAVRGALISDFD